MFSTTGNKCWKYNNILELSLQLSSEFLWTNKSKPSRVITGMSWEKKEQGFLGVKFRWVGWKEWNQALLWNVLCYHRMSFFLKWHNESRAVTMLQLTVVNVHVLKKIIWKHSDNRPKCNGNQWSQEVTEASVQILSQCRVALNYSPRSICQFHEQRYTICCKLQPRWYRWLRLLSPYGWLDQLFGVRGSVSLVECYFAPYWLCAT